jgi:hypothetical protein
MLGIGSGIVYHACAVIVLTILARDIAENLREHRRVEAAVGAALAGVVIVLWLLFGFGLIWKVLL